MYLQKSTFSKSSCDLRIASAVLLLFILNTTKTPRDFKQLENLERILLLKAGVVPVDVHLHLDLHHEVHNKVQHCSVFSCTFNVQNIWFGRGLETLRALDQLETR